MTFMMLDQDVVACSPASVYRVLKKAGLLAGPTPNVSKKGTGYVQPLKARASKVIQLTPCTLSSQGLRISCEGDRDVSSCLFAVY